MHSTDKEWRVLSCDRRPIACQPDNRGHKGSMKVHGEDPLLIPEYNIPRCQRRATKGMAGGPKAWLGMMWC